MMLCFTGGSVLLSVEAHAQLLDNALVMIAKRCRLFGSHFHTVDGRGMSVGPEHCEPIPGVLYQHECGPRRH